MGSDAAPAPGPAAFELTGAAVDLGGRRVLEGVDLTAGAGERVALIGPSGAGKTTLLRLLAGAVPPAAGSARVLGAAPAALPPAELRAFRARVGFIHQQHALVPMLRAVQNVAAARLSRHGLLGGLRRALLPSRAEAEEIHALLERVGIADHLYTRVDRLSGGERQRVAIARSLFQDPDLLLADEPVASVDPARARSLLELLLQLADERGLPLVASLHDLELAKEYFPRIVGLRGGRVAFDARRGPDCSWGEALAEDSVRALYALEEPR